MIFKSFDLFSGSFVVSNNSEAPFSDARGFLISCVKSVEKVSAIFILLYKSCVILFKELDNSPTSSLRLKNFSIVSVLISLSFIDLV